MLHFTQTAVLTQDIHYMPQISTRSIDMNKKQSTNILSNDNAATYFLRKLLVYQMSLVLWISQVIGDNIFFM